MTFMYLGSSILYNDVRANEKLKKKTMQITNNQWFIKLSLHLHFCLSIQSMMVVFTEALF